MPSHRLSHVRAWMLVSAAWVIPALLGGLDVFAQQRISNQPLDMRAVIFSAGDWLLYAVITPMVFVLARRFPLSRPHLRRHILLHLAAALCFCAVWAGAGTLLKLVVLPNTFDEGVGKFYASWVFTTLPFGVSVYLAVVGIEHAISYFVESQQREAQVARLAEQLMGARLATLQSQLNPHFLFNSLNTATILVREGESSVAARVLEQLSGMLRRTLNRGRQHEVPLEEELELVRQYLSVEEVRFSDRLDVRFDIEPGITSALVPSFALQHLVENAIRHGIARRTSAGRIEVGARRDGDMVELSVSDDGPGIPDEADRVPGHGLSSTRARIEALYGDHATLTLTKLAQDRGSLATLRVPFHLAPVRGGDSDS